MFGIRHSGARAPNENVREMPPLEGEMNVPWLKRSGMTQGVLLLGGSSLTDVRLRVAQSRLRSDLTPSHWSGAALVTGDGVFTVALDRIGDPGDFAANNGVSRFELSDFDDPDRYPNLAILLFSSTLQPIADALADVATGRAVLDVPALTAAWLAAVWAVVDLDEPLREGRGMPGAALVDLSHGIAGIELTPGLQSTATCPEAIWQSARWWTEYYREGAAIALRAAATPARGHAQPAVPAGAYVIRSRLVPPRPSSPREVGGR